VAWPVLFLIQIIIGAFIGGLTNELAIRMLFRPYKAKYIGKWRIPFTPGLIPKRHEELAFQMGKLVENFLITPEGIRKMMKKGEVEEEVTKWLQLKISEWETSEATVETALQKWGISLDEQIGATVKKNLKLFLEKKLSHMSHATMEEVLPVEIRDVVEMKVGEVSPLLLERMSGYLSSEEGKALVRQMLSQLVGGLGMLGGLATMLLSDEKVVNKVASSLEEAFKNKTFQDRLALLIQQEVRKLYKKQVGEVIDWIGQTQVEKGIELLVEKVVDIDQLREIKLSRLLGTAFPLLRENVPGVVRKLFAWVEAHLEQGLKKINLTKIAAEQVEAFPVHMLEKMIVSITGKELKMITVLGALLGGIIGAIQAVLVLWLG